MRKLGQHIGITPEQRAAMAASYESGQSLRALAREYGCSAPNVKHHLKAAGVEMRPGGRPSLPPDEKIAEMHAAGATSGEMSLVTGLTREQVRGRLRKLGLSIPRGYGRSGEAHEWWNGGRITINGGQYTAVLVRPDDPMASMAWANGYVPEHRIVMARSLGRVLKSTETVHHINGDGHDNRLENLQLRQGKHGTGVRMVCRDCGSHNVEAVDL